MIEINYASLGLLRLLIPKKLIALDFPVSSAHVWKIKTMNLQEYEATMLPSSRITAKLLILHFQVLGSRMHRYQIILPRMVGKTHFQDLLIYLKTH